MSTTQKPVTPKSNNKVPFIFGLIFLLVLISTSITYFSSEESIRNSAWISHTHKVQAWISHALSDMQDLETGQRGYLITGDEAYLAPFQSGLLNIDKSLSTLAQLTSDNDVQQRQIKRLQALKDIKIAELNTTISLRRLEGFDAAKALVLTNIGKHTMDDFRAIATQMTTEEDRLLAIREQETKESVHASIFMILLGNGFALFSLAGAIIILRRSDQKLHLALRDAQMASISKSEFLASMSHEIRTPMNGIIGMLTLLKKEPLNNQQYRYANMATASADSLLVIINDILDMSKIEARKMHIEYIEFDIKSLLSDLSKSMSLRTYEKGLELILDAEAVKHQMVIGDPGRIRQILTNLIGNAIKFTAEGEIVVRAAVTASTESPDNLQFECQIIDTGIGIPNHKITDLFNAFSQADSSTTREFGGTGLGLSIVKQLCLLMGGDVSAISEEGRGSQFTFSIQLKKSYTQLSPIPSIDMSGAPVLIVDDNHTNIEVLSGLLKEKGIAVTACYNAQECLHILEQQIKQYGTCPFKVAILDMQMPNMDGAELASLIRENTNYDAMSLILMTSMGSHGDAQHYTNLGFSGFFHKPIHDADLYDALALILAPAHNMQDEQLVTHENIVSMRSINEAQTINTLQHCKNKHVLLVEDHAINQIVAQSILEGFGITSDIAENGFEAIQHLKKAPNHKPYALVLMDCQMPVLDGYQASQKIRNGEAGVANINITIIAMTANAMQGDKEKCINAGMNDYLTKPIDEQLLLKRLSKWMPSKDNSTDQ
jgi:signal transduction histidine kinase/CheY-like chemotaxis protein